MTIWDEIEDDDPREWKKRIGIDPRIMFGKAVIAGTRLPVWIILEYLVLQRDFAGKAQEYAESWQRLEHAVSAHPHVIMRLWGKAGDKNTVVVLGLGMPIEEVLRSYPGLTREDVLAALLYAAEVTEEPVVAPS